MASWRGGNRTLLVALAVATLVSACAVGAGAASAPPPAPGTADVAALPAFLRRSIQAGGFRGGWVRVAAWTGTQVFVVGGAVQEGGNGNVGAVYDPAAGRWSRLPAPPIDSTMAFMTPVWTGRELVYAGPRCRPRLHDYDGPDLEYSCDGSGFVGTAYDPAKRRWRRLPPPPPSLRSRDVTGVQALALEDGQVVFTAFATDGSASSAVLVPATNSWRRLPSPPADGSGLGPRLCGSGSVVVASGYRAQSVQVLDVARATWTTVVVPPSTAGRVDTGVACGSGDVLTFLPSFGGGLGAVDRYDIASGAWRPVPPPDGEIGACLGMCLANGGAYTGPVAAQWSGSGEVFWSQAPNGAAAVTLGDDDSWRRVPVSVPLPRFSGGMVFDAGIGYYLRDSADATERSLARMATAP